MKTIELNPKFTKIVEAFALTKLKSKSLNLVPLAEAKINDNSYTLVAAVDKEKPNNGSLAIAVDSEGGLHTEAQLFEKYKKNIFTGELKLLPFYEFGVPTISPAINDLVLNLCDKFGERLTVNIPKNPVRNVDIYFLADTTGSMETIINSVKSNIYNIMSSISAPGANIAFGAGNYKDFPLDTYCFKNDISITTNTSAVASAVNSWVASGGNDGSEGQLFALNQIADATNTVGWRPNSLQIVVWFGDAPGHDPICPTISPQVGSNPITEFSVTQKLKAPQLKRVLAISVNTGYLLGLDDDPNSSTFNYPTTTCTPNGIAGQATRITAATQGSLITDINSSNIVNSIISMIQANLSIINNVRIVPTGNILPFICSINPKNGYGNLKTDIEHNLEFIVCFKGSVPCGPKDKKFKGTFDVVMDGVVVAQKKVFIEVPSCSSKGKCNCNCCG